jgi:hypothetical protein
MKKPCGSGGCVSAYRETERGGLVEDEAGECEWSILISNFNHVCGGCTELKGGIVSECSVSMAILEQILW